MDSVWKLNYRELALKIGVYQKIQYTKWEGKILTVSPGALRPGKKVAFKTSKEPLKNYSKTNAALSALFC